MTQRELLKPCPFCGSAAEEIAGSGRLMPTLEEAMVQAKHVRCSSGSCGARYVPGGFLRDEWNRRAATPDEVRVPREPTKEMIEAGAQRLVSWGENSKWPDSWDRLHVIAARNDAEKVWRSMWLAAAEGES